MDSAASRSSRVVFRFILKSGDRWNWPVEGRDGIAAFRDLLDRAKVVYAEVEADA